MPLATGNEVRLSEVQDGEPRDKPIWDLMQRGEQYRTGLRASEVAASSQAPACQSRAKNLLEKHWAERLV